MFRAPFSFEGRIRRLEFGISFVIYVFAIGILTLAAENVSPLINLLAYPFYWFMTAQACKRCHDRNTSGWFQSVSIYFIWMLFADGEIGANRFGNNPKDLGNELTADELNRLKEQERYAYINKQHVPMFRNVFSFDGRVRRLEFGIIQLSILSVFIVLGIVWAVTQYSSFSIGAFNIGLPGYIILAALLPAGYIGAACSAKRLHDTGHRGWWQLDPGIGGMLLFADSDFGINEYGENPKGLGNEIQESSYYFGEGAR